MSTIGENIKRLRQATRIDRTMSQTDLAAKTGLKPCAISHFETGKRTPSVKNLVKLAEALGVTLDDLVKGHFHD